MAILNIGNQYKYTGKGPFDSKLLVTTYAKLLLTDTWGGHAYNGMIVGVGLNKDDISKNGIYYLYDATVTNALGSPDVTNEANWHRVGTLAEIDAIAERVSALENDGTGSGVDENAVNALIDARIDALRAEIAEASYLTEADLEGYAKTADIEANYATKNDVDASKIINISSIYELPNVGEVGYFYINETDGKTYIWDVENSKMVNFGIHSVKVIDGGDANSVYGA